MSRQYPLYQSHIDLAHQHLESIIKPGDTVIDATCGNGHDTLVLAKLALTSDSGKIFAIDRQADAIESTKQLLTKQLSRAVINRIEFSQRCHSTFPEHLTPRSVNVFQYNLGYLPGGNKAITTTVETTLQSIRNAMQLLQAGGLILITCYPGHAEGMREEEAIIKLCSSFDPKIWSCSHYRWMNRSKAPSLVLIQKKLLTYIDFPVSPSVFRESE